MACVSACRYVITDAAAVELANYEASSETQELIVDSAWTVWIVEDGVATEGTNDQIVVGDVIIIYTDSDGVEISWYIIWKKTIPMKPMKVKITSTTRRLMMEMPIMTPRMMKTAVPKRTEVTQKQVNELVMREYRKLFAK